MQTLFQSLLNISAKYHQNRSIQFRAIPFQSWVGFFRHSVVQCYIARSNVWLVIILPPSIRGCYYLKVHVMKRLPICPVSGLHLNLKFLRFCSSVLTSSPTDPIPTWLLNVCAAILTPAITKIVNLFFTSGQFHPILKEYVVSPLFKKPALDKDQLSNYRLISNHFVALSAHVWFSRLKTFELG